MPDRQETNHPPAYRAYRVSAAGRIVDAPTILDASTDEEAIAQARQLVDSLAIEVWNQARCVIALPPKHRDGSGQHG